MKTKLVSLFVAFFASTALWAYNFKSEDGLCYSYTYTYDESGNATVMVVPENDDQPAYSSLASSVSIPTSVIYNGTIYSVTSIGWYAFSGCTGLASVTIPNSVTSIESEAFSGCTGLTSVTIPNSVTSIGDRAFEGCTGLTSIVVEGGNTVYDSRNNCNAIIETETNTLIRGCNITVIPNSVTSIGYEAFSGCTGLTSVTIPNGVTSIGDRAFSGCTGLTSVTIGNSVTSIGWYAFFGCTGLTSITIPNSVTSIEYGAFSDCSGLASIVVEGGNTVYDSQNNCNAIIETETNTLIRGCNTTVIPNSVTSIEYGAFSGCTGLTSVTIPNSVTSIEGGAFSDCSGLASIVVENGNKVYDSRSNCNAIIEISTNTLIQGCKTTIIPNSVTSIGNEAFYGCTGLTSIIIPNSVTSIEDFAFTGCTGLTSLTIPNSVMDVGEDAFGGCTGLTSVLIGNNSELSMDATFFDSKNLTQVTCYANVPPHIWLPKYFDTGSLTEKTLYVPASAVGDYKEANGWKYFGHIVPIGATATDTDEPVIMPSYTEVTIAWPTTIGAKTYTITITQEGKTISSLTFDDTGLLIDAAFAVPSDNGNARQAPAAQNTQSAFWFTFSGLECNTQYDYSIVAQSSNGQPISTYNGTFRTTAPTAIDNVSSSSSNNAATQTRKVFRNGQVLIQHNGKTYTISGNEVK